MHNVQSHLKNNICPVFSFENLQHKAVECGFYKRSSKLLPATFFDVLLRSASVNGTFSLSQFSSEAELTHAVSVSKQAFDARFDAAAVAFIRGILEQIIAGQVAVPLDPRFLARFNRVMVKDATRFDLPTRLKEHFAGFGGKITSEAAAAIQFEFDLKSWRLHDLDITSAKKTDFQDAREKVENVERGDLIIRDLGYFSSLSLKSIMHKEAFFLSRLKAKMIVLDEQGQEVSFKNIYENMAKSGSVRRHMEVTIGDKERIPVRLLVETVPEEVYAGRIRKRAMENKKKGQKTSEEFKARARFNLMVTNVPEDDLPAEHVYKLYKTRWQIELLFKTWKSTLGINTIHPMRHSRLMCLLYAKLILYLVAAQTTKLFEKMLYRRQKKHLSMYKCTKTILLTFERTRNALVLNKAGLPDYVRSVHALLSKNHWLENKKSKSGFAELFNLFSCISTE